jgi:UbiA prenyltransferase family
MMALAAANPVSPSTLLKLGRVSNLPTIWTNVLAGVVLSGRSWQNSRTAVVLVAMSLFYVGGMYLNDYFDRAIDARERPARPIPAEEISAAAVAAIGFGLLAAGIALMTALGTAAALAGVVLAALIAAYDAFHKNNPVAPIIMGACRACVYGGAAAALDGSVPVATALAALALLAYVAGLTYAARQESLDTVGTLWPLLVLSPPFVLALPALQQGLVGTLIYLLFVAAMSYALHLLARRPMPGAVPRAVALLIAGISLADAAFLASAGAAAPAVLAAGGFVLTLALQRYVPGT